MRNRNASAPVCGLVVLALATLVACTDAPPVEPHARDDGAAALFGGPVEDPQSFDGHLDAHFERIAREVPGFGGYFYDEAGTLTVAMIPGASPAPLHSRLGTFQVREAQYDFLELNALRLQAMPVLGIGGVVFLDTDEAANRVRIGVENDAVASHVKHALGMLQVPAEAVIINLAEPILPLQGLRDRVRPLAGGLQINGPGFICTLGFNVRAPDRPSVHGFMINSHCTNIQGQVDNTPYWQPHSSMPESFIGNEVHDVPFFAGGACPIGRVCRWSDTAGGRYVPGVENAFGRIYRTTGVNTGSLVIDPANPMFNITAERPFPYLGDVMHKVGRTTGWTSGMVVATCTDVNVGFSNITLLCQEQVRGSSPIAAGGDSGSPIFDLVPGQMQNVRLTGILWGGNQSQTMMIFSAMAEIRFENPALLGLAWTTHP
jgi:hypothetical protein